jgi:hypothetical protein
VSLCGDERILPRRIEQLFLRDQPVAVLDQISKDVECLRLERHGVPGTCHRHAPQINRNVFEPKHFGRHHNVLIFSGNNITRITRTIN